MLEAILNLVSYMTAISKYIAIKACIYLLSVLTNE